jgi:hypothetical protein
MKVYPYHTNQPEVPNVYHDHDDCEDGRRILPQHKVAGTAGRDRCEVCAKKG